MPKLLMISHSGFSDENANGITMKNLLSAWTAEEKAELYFDVQPPDFRAASACFRVTDLQMLRSFLGKKSRHIFFPGGEDGGASEDMPASGSCGSGAPKIPAGLKRLKYCFPVKWLRELLWMWGPWGKRAMETWVDTVAPEAMIYMVGESIFMDRLVLRLVKRVGKPLILYHSEAYRIIPLSERHGIERAYYRQTSRLYQQLNDAAALVIYNSAMLQCAYENQYPGTEGMVAYNSAVCDFRPYVPSEEKAQQIVYFGNTGVGRVDSLIAVAQALETIDPALEIQVYGTAQGEDLEKLRCTRGIRYHGFVPPAQLHGIIEQADLLLHVESFDEKIRKKLRYAFSTKIAQCLCAGRCLVTFAPMDTASTQYLASLHGAAAVVCRQENLRAMLEVLVNDAAVRAAYAARALDAGKKNHAMEKTSGCVRKRMEERLRLK